MLFFQLFRLPLFVFLVLFINDSLSSTNTSSNPSNSTTSSNLNISSTTPTSSLTSPPNTTSNTNSTTASLNISSIIPPTVTISSNSTTASTSSAPLQTSPLPVTSSLLLFSNSSDDSDGDSNATNTCIIIAPKCSDGSCCSYSLAIPAATHKYCGGLIILFFIIGQTIHYFYLEDKKAKAYKADEPVRENMKEPDEKKEEEEKDRRKRLAYGISTDSYLVEEVKTPGGRMTKVLEKRPRQSFALAPPITPASINGMYQSRVKTVVPTVETKDEMCEMVVTADKWGRGTELISLINNTEVPSTMETSEEKAKFVMETVQGHVERMTEQKVFLHGLLDDRHRLLCGSDKMDMETFSEVRLELKLEMTAPIRLLINVFTVKVEPHIEQPITAQPGRFSELTSIPNKETPRTEKAQAVEQNNKGKSTISKSGKEKLSKDLKPSPEGKKERKDSSRRKGTKKTSEPSETAPLLQQTVQVNEKPSKEKNTTPKQVSAPVTPEKLQSSGQTTSTLKKKKEAASVSNNSNPSAP